MQKSLNRGAAMVEFALGVTVFLALFFGTINLSLYLFSKIMATRALDRALERLVGDARFSVDSHLIKDNPATPGVNEATEAKNKVKEARTEAALIGSQFVDSTWVGSQLVEYQIDLTAGGVKGGAGGEEIESDKLKSRVAILRPGRKSNSFVSTEEWKTTDASIAKGAINKKVEYLFPSAPGSDCYISGTNNGNSVNYKYSEILPKCPYVAFASVMFNMWPFGKFQFDVQALRYADIGSQKPTPQVASTWSSTQATAVPTPTYTIDPNAPPTATARPTTTPNPTNTPSNDCPYTIRGDAEAECCAAMCGGGKECCYEDPYPCAVECSPPNAGRFRCSSNCTGT